MQEDLTEKEALSRHKVPQELVDLENASWACQQTHFLHFYYGLSKIQIVTYVLHRDVPHLAQVSVHSNVNKTGENMNYELLRSAYMLMGIHAYSK